MYEPPQKKQKRGRGKGGSSSQTKGSTSRGWGSQQTITSRRRHPLIAESTSEERQIQHEDQIQVK